MRFDSATLVATTVVSGSFEITGTTIPGDGSAYDLGSSSKVWRNVYSTAFSGSLTKLATGGDYLVAGNNITLTTGSSGAITITAAGTSGGSIIAGSDTQVQFNDGGNFGADSNFTFNKTTDTLSVTNLSGSLTRLSNGSSFIVAGSSISVTSGSNGSITISSTSTSADLNPSYLLLSATSSLPNERVFTPGTGLSASDGGSGGNYTLSVDDSVVATVSGSTFSGAVNFNGGLSGSLTRLTNGTSYLVAGPGISIVTQSNGSILITGSSQVTLGGTDSYVQFNDGGSFGGDPNFTFNKTTDTLTVTNLSGSLTKLSGGGDYLVAGSNITLVTGSNGSVTISSTTNGASVIAGTNTQIQFNDGGNFGASSGLTYNKNTGALTGTYVVASTGFSGSLTKLSSGGDYLIAGSNITLSTGSTGAITISSTTNGASVIAGSDTQLQFNDGGNFGASSGLTYNKNTGALTGTYVVASTGFSGSLTKLKNGDDYLVAGSNITLTTGSNGSITINAALSPYTTQQFTNTTSITVNHSLGLSLYDIEVFDTSYNKVIPKSATATSSTQANITFGSPKSGYIVVGGSGGGGGGGGSTNVTTSPDSFNADGSTDTFTISSGYTANKILVFVNGIYYHPTEDYSVTGTSLIFTATPVNGSQIRIRYLTSS